MKKNNLRYLAIFLMFVTAVVIAFIFINKRPLPVEVVHPTRTENIQVFGLGTIEARILSKIGFEAGAALAMLDADHGDYVKKGQILALLHSGEQEARVARARAGVVRANAGLKMAEAAVGKSWAVLAQKKQTNKRKQALVASHTISAEAAEEAQLEQDVAKAELAVAMSDTEVAKAALEDAKAQYGLEKVLLGHHILKAPYDAVVVQRHKELGAVLSPGEPLFTLVAPETVWALAYVDEARAGDIRLGQRADVHLRSLPKQVLKGHIARIDKESDRVSEERRVYIACELCPKNFHLGEQAEVFITTATLENALLVPQTAVQKANSVRGTVWTVENGNLHRREVTLGHRTLDARVEIIAGLPANAHVVSVLGKGLQEGRAAKIQNSNRQDKIDSETP